MEVLCEVLLFYNENGGLFCFEYLFTILGVVSHGPAGQVKCPIAVRGAGDKCVVPDC